MEKNSNQPLNQAERYQYLIGLTEGKQLDADYRAAFYILSSVPEMFEAAAKCVDHEGITFDKIKRLCKGKLEESQMHLLSLAHNVFAWNSRTKLNNNVMKLNEHNGVILACKQHPLLGYVLSTYKQDTQNNNRPIQRQYFYNKEEAFESFAVRSGLVDEKKLFTESELKILYDGLIKVSTQDESLSHLEPSN